MVEVGADCVTTGSELAVGSVIGLGEGVSAAGMLVGALAIIGVLEGTSRINTRTTTRVTPIPMIADTIVIWVVLSLIHI